MQKADKNIKYLQGIIFQGDPDWGLGAVILKLLLFYIAWPQKSYMYLQYIYIYTKHSL